MFNFFLTDDRWIDEAIIKNIAIAAETLVLAAWQDGIEIEIRKLILVQSSIRLNLCKGGEKAVIIMNFF